jgi:hypothetical protein
MVTWENLTKFLKEIIISTKNLRLFNLKLKWVIYLTIKIKISKKVTNFKE